MGKKKPREKEIIYLFVRNIRGITCAYCENIFILIEFFRNYSPCQNHVDICVQVKSGTTYCGYCEIILFLLNSFAINLPCQSRVDLTVLTFVWKVQNKVMNTRENKVKRGVMNLVWKFFITFHIPLIS